jgi:hypothetical protein
VVTFLGTTALFKPKAGLRASGSVTRTQKNSERSEDIEQSIVMQNVPLKTGMLKQRNQGRILFHLVFG